MKGNLKKRVEKLEIKTTQKGFALILEDKWLSMNEAKRAAFERVNGMAIVLSEEDLRL